MTLNVTREEYAQLSRLAGEARLSGPRPTVPPLTPDPPHEPFDEDAWHCGVEAIFGREVYEQLLAAPEPAAVAVHDSLVGLRRLTD